MVRSAPVPIGPGALEHYAALSYLAPLPSPRSQIDARRTTSPRVLLLAHGPADHPDGSPFEDGCLPLHRATGVIAPEVIRVTESRRRIATCLTEPTVRLLKRCGVLLQGPL